MKNILLFFAFLSLLGCGKKLDLKPNSRLVIPSTAKDFEHLLDNTNAVMNVTPALAQLSADEYFIPTLANFQALRNVTARTTYLWDQDIFQGQTQITDWLTPYKAIFYANSVLDLLAKQDISTDLEKQNIKGWALFVRAYTLYALASNYCKAYDERSAATDLGLPLKLNPNIDEVVPRSSLRNTYDQLIQDAIASSELLQQDIITDKRNRPSKVAAYALLARVYLSMRKYEQAEQYVDEVMQLYPTLVNFNTLSTTASSAFTYNSVETIYFSQENLSLYTEASAGALVVYGVDKTLLALYPATDLRLKLYFRLNTVGNYNTKPINSSSQAPFTGLATDEMYLIKAECLARRNQKDQALGFLNDLVKNRMQTGSFQTLTASDAQTALDLILTERRKALVWRSIRWTDLKRLNVEGRNITISRNLDGKIYTLEPNSPKYVMPIPDDEISLSGVQQNIR